uniref:ATPase family protein n=1 Tax=Pithovirus LCDPAC02 TaxID=2506601 RepID=A0A481YRQ1_9VIRU|nr:MAG: ATPase family protein [Pithovirus LCDPAC02]
MNWISITFTLLTLLFLFYIYWSSKPKNIKKIEKNDIFDLDNFQFDNNMENLITDFDLLSDIDDSEIYIEEFSIEKSYKLFDSEKFQDRFKQSLLKSFDIKLEFYKKMLSNLKNLPNNSTNGINGLEVDTTQYKINRIKEIISNFEKLRKKYKSGKFNINKRFETVKSVLNTIVGRNDLKEIIINDIMLFCKNSKLFFKHYKNMVIYGNPGCGKSYTSEKISNIYSILGIFTEKFAKVSLDNFKNAWSGQSSKETIKTLYKLLEKAGFFDEAYSLNGHGYITDGTDVNNEIFTSMVDFLAEFEGKHILIIAGYPGLMKKWLKNNDGLDRRFPIGRRINLNNYSNMELFQIFMRKIKESENKIKFCNKSKNHIYKKLCNVIPELKNGASDIVSISDRFLNFIYTTPKIKWVNNKYSNNSKIINTFFKRLKLKNADFDDDYIKSDIIESDNVEDIL